MECADPIVEPSQAEAWWEDGLRSVMLAHFGFSHYAAGTGVSGPLTPKGIELLKQFERIGMILDPPDASVRGEFFTRHLTGSVDLLLPATTTAARWFPVTDNFRTPRADG